MNNLFGKHDRWGHGHALWILVAMVFVIPPAWWAVRQVDMHNDVSNWLPAHDPQAKTLNWFHDQFGSEERLLISWESSSLTDPRLGEVVTALRGTSGDSSVDRRTGSPYLKKVSSPVDALKQILKSKVEPEDAVARLAGTIIGIGPLQIRLSDVGRARLQTTKDLIAEMVDAEFGVPAVITERTEEQIANAIPLVLEINEDKTVEIPPIDSDLKVSWSTMTPGSQHVAAFQQRLAKLSANGDQLIERCFQQPGSPVALSIVLSEEGRAERSEAIDDIRERFASVGIPEPELRMGGSPVAGNALNQGVKQAAWNRNVPVSNFLYRSPVLTSFLVGIVLSVLLLRSLRLVLLVQIVAGYTMFLSVAMVPVTGGSMNMVVVVMPTLLMVLTLSAAIHIVNYWKHATESGTENAVQTAIRAARLPCTLAAITTALGLLSLTTSPLAPVGDFGLYSAVGCSISLVAVLYGLPALLLVGLRPKSIQKTASNGGNFWDSFGRFLIQHRTAVTATALTLFVGCLVGLTRFQTQVKVIRYFPEDSRLVQDYNFLEQQLSGIVPVEVIVRFDEASQDQVTFLERQKIVQDVQDEIRNHPEISGVISLATFLPEPAKRPAPTANRALRMLYRRRSNETAIRVKAQGDSSSGFLVNAEASNDLAESGDNGLNAAGDELWRITAQVGIQSDFDYADLQPDLDRRTSAILKRTPGASHVVTGMVPVFLRTQQAVLESLINSFAMAFATIAVVLICVLRNPLAGLLTMLPNLFPVGVVFGAVSWFGMQTDIGTMITASVALGIAVDGTLHLLTWYKKRIAAGESQDDAVRQALAHCGAALWQTSAVVGIGLLMLWPAELRLISRFGWVMSALIGTALIADLVLLPAMLAGPLGRMIAKTVTARMRVEQDKIDSGKSDAGKSDPKAVGSPANSQPPQQSVRAPNLTGPDLSRTSQLD